MKILLVLWAIGFASCDKLDRTYLPPRGSISAGGYSEDLDLPLEFSNENRPSTSKLGKNGTTDNSLSSKYPNIALGIDREGPFVTPIPKFTKRPETFVSKTIYNIPPTTKSYESTGTSSFVPVEIFDPTVGPITTVPQRYSSTSSSFDPNLTYDQYLIQENIKENKASQIIPNYISRDSVTNLPNKNIDILSGDSDIKVVNNQGDFFSYGGDLDGTSEVTIPSTNKSNFDNGFKKPTFNTFSTQRIPFNSDGIDAISQKQYDSVQTELSSTVKPGETFLGKSDLAASSKYGSIPISSNNFDTRYNTMFQPQREQAEDDRNAVILNYQNILTPEGFAYSFDTSNGIHADESGTANNGVRAKGSYSFTGDDGKIYTVEYTADENGFLPRGNHLPTAPPVPDAILKNIEIAEQNRNLGIIEDGSYDNDKYGHHKYQGLMDRIPQNEYNNIINQANFKESKSNNLGNNKPAYNTKNGQIYNKISSTSEPSISSYSPDKSQMIEAYPKATNKDGDDNISPSFYYTNRSDKNDSFNSEDDNFNNPPITERNKFRGSTMTIAPTDEKYEILNPGDVDNILPKAYNGQNDYDSGYVYTLPKNMFFERDQNLPSKGPNYGISSDVEKHDDEINGDEFTGPNTSFQFQTQRPVTSSPVLGKTFNNYVTASDVQNKGLNIPDLPISSNKESDRFRNGQIINPERVYSNTLRPKVVTTTRGPYNYDSPYAFGENSKQSTYPSSTYRPEYSQSTTPIPSDVSSSIIPSTSIYRYSTPSTSSGRYSVTTPTTSQISSTLRPSISSRRPTLNIPSGLSSYTVSVSEPEEEDSGVSTTRPNQFGERIIGRPGSDSRGNKIPITKTGLSEDVEPGFVESTDPRSQDLGLSFIPGNVNSQSLTEGVIGEDFNGPKQPQRFDPKYGYYY